MFDLNSQRLGLMRLRKHRAFMGHVAHYDHDQVFYECGSPSCSAGYMTVSLPDVITGREYANQLVMGDQRRLASLGLTRLMGEFLFVSACTFRDKGPWMTKCIRVDTGLKTTLRRLDLIIAYMARRVAALEREALDSRAGRRRERKARIEALTLTTV